MIIADDFETDMWSAEETTSETTEEVKENVTTVEEEPVQVQSEAAMQTNTMNYTADIAEAATSEPQKQNADEFEIQNDIIKEEKIMDTMDTNVMTETEVVAEPAVETVAPVAANNAVTDEVSVITAGTSIKGNMETTGSFEIEGRIEGDIKCNGKLTVIGSILGNSASSEFFADSAHIEGEVVSSGTVKVGLGSVIIGNITATSAVIAGAVKGDIDVQGPVVVDTSAVIMGNIKSRSVQINNGAVIEGFCSQCYSDVDMESLFSKNK
ncbi:MAG: polymer-forming cytoskeletal protein [Eubacterium sp.]|nr:polymer-forming cytoskeletal protein [Eubacterium sp.]